MKFSTTYYLLGILLLLASFRSVHAQSESQVEVEETIAYDNDYNSEENYSLNNPRTNYLNKELQQQRFEEQRWREAIQDYDYTNAREKDRDEDFDETLTNSNRTGNGGSSSRFSLGSEFWSVFFKFLLIAAAVVTFTLLMINLVGGGSFFGPRSKKIKANNNQITIENLEDNILESDLDKFIRTATEEHNYALAIRLYYLAIIKELSLKKSIKWKRDKTNRDYLREMRQNKLFLNFREATAVFERIWYGNINLTPQDYQNIKPKFQQLIQTIQSNSGANK